MALESLKDPAIRAAAMAATPMKKIAKPEDITGTIAYLSSWKLSGHITGEVITMYDLFELRLMINSSGGMEGRLINSF
jgi:3-oxoacyl-[acyl-carrier protein] reductase